MADLNDGLDGKLKTPEQIRELRHVYQERMFAAQKELAAPTAEGMAKWSGLDKDFLMTIIQSEVAEGASINGLPQSLRMYREYAAEAAANCARMVDALNWVLGTVN